MKTWIWLVIVQICFHFVLGQNSCQNLSANLESACEYTKKLTVISSPNKNQVDSNNCNAEYLKADWQEQPTIVFQDANPNKTYTLLYVDPDAIFHNKGQFYLHWLVSNIKGEDFIKGDLSKAKHHQGYYGPEPSAGTGLHRYMFIAYEEDGNMNKKMEAPTRRSKFELLPWLQRQENLCGPVAGIQFRTKF